MPLRISRNHSNAFIALTGSLSNNGLAYDEEDAGFAFTRTRAKKAKAEPTQPAIVEEAAPSKEPEPAPQKRPRKRSEDKPSAALTNNEQEKSTRRSTRNSGGSQEETDPPTLAVKKRRKRGSDEREKTPAASEEHANDASRRQEPEQDHTHPIQISSDSTQIALPFADTPIIRRNQEMRRGVGSASRRSSLGNRGRRASSLIDTGKSNGTFLYSKIMAFGVDTAQHYRTTKSSRPNSTST